MTKALELWAGLECTVNRVGDVYFDQMKLNGHWSCPEDIYLIAQLGIQVMRYPVLWEHVAPDSLNSPDWSWPDERLALLRDRGIQTIAGLLHHGSGPRYTSLMDPEFPTKLATYARQVALRYPWIEMYTPVNEPLTTARFSGLYGHWYPHERDPFIFAQCLLNECKGTVLAMREIRKITPQAQLIQTEDVGKTYSTPLLQYQADFENERRWLSFDLLCGRLNSELPMWHYLLEIGVSEEELHWFIDNPCPPDMIGINHYLTSDRYLDENLALYPSQFYGGNGTHAYADEAAIRVNLDIEGGISSRLQEVWARYQIPISITEAHLGCTREEQLRWLHDFWNAAKQAREIGVDLRAVTVWSMLGSFNWNTLVTQDNGFYEPGVFDRRAGLTRPTALAEMVQRLARAEDYYHPVLAVPGWWKREDRYFYPEAVAHDFHALEFHLPSAECVETQLCPRTITQPLIIIGANGTLGKAFARICNIRGIPYYLLSRQELNICDSPSVVETLGHFSPWAIINAAGYVRVDDAEQERTACWRDNVLGPVTLAKACARFNIPLLTFSSDMVFNGQQNHSYLESDSPDPLNVYGLSKAAAERQVLSIFPEALIIRTSAFFGPWDNHNFVTIALNQLAEGKHFSAANDMIISPTYVPDLVHCCLDLLIDQEQGLWHLSNHTEITWFELAQLAASKKGLDTHLLKECAGNQWPFNHQANRPPYSVLGTERCRVMPPLEDALNRYIQETPPVSPEKPESIMTSGNGNKVKVFQG